MVPVHLQGGNYDRAQKWTADHFWAEMKEGNRDYHVFRQFLVWIATVFTARMDHPHESVLDTQTTQSTKALYYGFNRQWTTIPVATPTSCCPTVVTSAWRTRRSSFCSKSSNSFVWTGTAAVCSNYTRKGSIGQSMSMRWSTRKSLQRHITCPTVRSFSWLIYYGKTFLWTRPYQLLRQKAPPNRHNFAINQQDEGRRNNALGWGDWLSGVVPPSGEDNVDDK